MSTRATYEIAGQTFYIHHDGYPAGAASYFENMIGALTVAGNGQGIDAIADRRGGALFAFIRGNLRAEPTESHDVHGDTEYRWKILGDAGALHVSSQKRSSAAGYHWGAWSKPEPLEQFINRHYPGAIVALETSSFDPYWKRTLYATTANAVKIAAEYFAQATKYKDDNPNKASNLKRAEAWERVTLEQLPARVHWLEKEQAEAADELAKLDRNGSDWGRPYYVARLAEIAAELEILRAGADRCLETA